MIRSLAASSLKITVTLLIGLLLSVRGLAFAESKSLALVKGGTFEPFYAPSLAEKKVRIAPFWLDRLPVTNADFLNFVKNHPEWQRGTVASLFVDENYLSHWQSPTTLGQDIFPRQPVTQVSWFAAKAYCEAQGERLPTEMEWEYAAWASPTEVDGRNNAAFRQKILDWYEKPAAKILPEVGKSQPNYWGVQDLHGLVWEWVSDYNGTLANMDSRDKEKMSSRFCGGAALAASVSDDYPSFLRMSMRSSLKANYTTMLLGFRCARDK